MLIPLITIIALHCMLGFAIALRHEPRPKLRVPKLRLKLRRAAEATPADHASPRAPEGSAVAPAPSPAPPIEPVSPPAVDAMAPAAKPLTIDEPPASQYDSVSSDDESADTSQSPKASTFDEEASDNGVDEHDYHRADAKSSEEDATPEYVAPSQAATLACTDIPEEWHNLLAEVRAEGYGECQSFVEASTQVLRLEVGRYRGQLVEIDRRVRQVNSATPLGNDFDEILADLQRVNRDWLDRQAEAVQHFVGRRENLGNFEAIGQRLEDVLLDQTAQIESSCSNLAQLAFVADPAAAIKQTIVEIGRLVDMAHALRDGLQDSLLAIIKSEGRVATLDRRLHRDSLTGFINLTGLEAVLYEWWRDDPARVRQLSLVSMDVVYMARFNQRFGPATGDAMLAAVAKIIDEQLRKKRGRDLVVRQSGQRFIVVLGDTGPRNATSAAERIRQVLAASTCEIDDATAEPRVTCGVVEVLAGDTSDAALERLNQAVMLAKRSGRNCTSLDEGRGPALIEEPPVFEVKGKVVRLANQ